MMMTNLLSISNMMILVWMVVMLMIFVIVMQVMTRILRMVIDFRGKEIILYRPKCLPIEIWLENLTMMLEHYW